MLDPKIVHDPISRVTAGLNIFAIFGTFGRHVTNLRGSFVANIKKSKINPS
jgi:hypothetical protein